MIYVGGLNVSQGQSWAENVAASVARNVPLTEAQRNLLIAELQDPKYKNLDTSTKLIELSKSTVGPGQIPRTECLPGEFMVVRSKASKVASSPSATAMQKVVWAQFQDPSLGMGSYDKIDLTSSDVRQGLDGCLAVGLITQEVYNLLLWQDAGRSASWVERTYGPGYVLMPSDIEGLD